MVACTCENEVSSIGVLLPCGFEEAANRDDTERENKSLFPCMSNEEEERKSQVRTFLSAFSLDLSLR